ncbi:MAG: prepilin-type N-terminal cleavage/methylation domain-containing protein [Candidatus Paceibacterota bacterium]|jgi:type II secretory pathway pseudopilin PulG
MFHYHKRKGMSLLETIVYIAVFAFVMLAITNAMINFYQANRYTLEQMSQLDSARKGVNSMIFSLREAAYSESGAYPLETVEGNSLTFYSDVDNDGTIERVRYFLTGNDFQRGVIKPVGIPALYNPGNETVTNVAKYVRNAEQGLNVFTYFDTAGSQMTAPFILINIRWIQIKLIVNVNPATMPNEFTLRSSATLRNLKSNL